jgi:hypothetical protein
MHTFMRAIIGLALVLVLPATGLASTIVAFSGSGAVGTSGTDPFGHGWEINTTILDPIGNGAWGIPGLGSGTLPYAGTESAYDFHITFTDSQGAIAINDITPNPEGTCCYNESTRFASTTDALVWTRIVTGNSVSFFAPGTNGLDLGDSFFVNVTFLRPIVGELSFNAEWTNAAVPEPGSLLLLGTGLVGAAAVRRWRQRKA